MIKNSFSFCEGVSVNSELKLKQEVNCWEDFLEKFETLNSLPRNKLEKIKTQIIEATEHYNNKNIFYFKDKLAEREHWKLKDLGRIAYVDIETTGLSKYSHEITTIGIYDGIEPKVYIQGKDLNQAYDHLEQFDIVVTFNGKTFDMPFIEHHAKKKFNLVHLDLRYLLKELGLSGGLKNIELQLGITRPDEVAGVDGYEAVRLWRRYKQGNLEALETLIKYNIEDIVNLKFLLEHYIENKLNN